MFRFISGSRRVFTALAVALMLGVSTLPAWATDPLYTPPAGLEAEDVQANVFAVVSPAIPVILGIGATMTIVWAIYRVITRKTAKRA